MNSDINLDRFSHFRDYEDLTGCLRASTTTSLLTTENALGFAAEKP